MKLAIFSLNISRKRLLFFLLAFSCITEALYISLYYFPVLPAILYKKYILTSCICFLLYFANLYFLDKLSKEYNNTYLLTFILITGIVFRLTLLPLPPFLSDDIYRYVWDGFIQANGINPYLYAPNSEKLALFQSFYAFKLVNHPNLPTIYPPLAQILFFLAYLITKHSIIGIKLLIFIAEIISAILLTKTLQKLNLNLTKVAIYFLSPLPIIEFSISAHIDSVGLMFLFLLIYSLTLKKTKLSAFSFANAILIKILPIILLPILIKLYKNLLFTFIITFLLIVCLLYLPYLSIGIKVLGSLGNFAKDFYFNSSIFSILYFLTNNNHLSASICYILLVLWILLITFKSTNFINASFWVFIGFYVFSPIVHPWYLTWIMPFLVFCPSRKLFYAVFWLMISCQSSYYVLVNYKQNGIWQDSAIIRVIEYVPFFALLGQDLLRFLFSSKNILQEKNSNGNNRKTS